MSDISTVVIPREDIEGMQVEEYTEPLHRLTSDWELLRDQLQKTVFLVSGYDDDLRELHEVEEVIKFMEYFNRECPFWLLFTNLDTPGGNAWMIRCLCATGDTVQDDESQVVVSLDWDRYLEFMRWQLQHIYTIIRKSGGSEEDTEQVLSGVATSMRNLMTVPS